MKKTYSIVLAALLTAAALAGCRSKPNDNKTPSTTTVPTTMPTTQATTQPADPTIPSGNGPIDGTSSTSETNSSTDSTISSTAETGTR